MNKSLIAVVDDELDILELYQSLLGDQFEVRAFNKPELFLEQLQNPDFKNLELLISDLKMPKIDGVEMVRRAQDLGFRFPFILLSGHLDKDAAIQAVDLGAFRLLEKPTNYEVLMSAIDQLMIEHEILNVRKEVRHITTQLRELYSSVRLILSQHIPPEIIDRLVIETNSEGHVQKKMSFENLLEQLENRLDKMLESEKFLTELKNSKGKN